jgi:hypothetical protein
MTRNQVPAILSGVALLLSAGLVSAQDIDAKSFRCITKMTHVRQFYVDNLLGNLDATLAVRRRCPCNLAKSPCISPNCRERQVGFGLPAQPHSKLLI